MDEHAELTNRGGLRNPPGGRPPKQPEERKVKISITISQGTRNWLKTQRTRSNEPISQVVERKLRDLQKIENPSEATPAATPDQ